MLLREDRIGTIDVDRALRDPERLRTLETSGLLDELDDEDLDRYTRLARRSLGVPVALVNLLDDERQVYKSCVGLPEELREARQAPLSHSYCKYVVARSEPLVVSDAREHPFLRDNPAIEEFDAIAYMGFPLTTREGHVLGTLCVVDRTPREWSGEEIETLRDLTAGAEREIRLHREVELRRELEQELALTVEDQAARLEDAQDEMLTRLAAATEYRDDMTGRHTRRVGSLAARLAERLGADAAWIARLRKAAPLHDIGKVAVPDEILLKDGPLSDPEYETMKRHTLIGARLLEGGRSELVQLAESVARSHHERWDGTGYPDGLEGEEIPFAGRIVAVADAFDAMTHDRPYREALSIGEAFAELREGAGSQFDPRVVEAMSAGMNPETKITSPLRLTG